VEADLIGTDGGDSTRQTVDWGHLIWPSGRPTGGSQVLADRAAAAEAVARRAAGSVETLDWSAFPEVVRSRPPMVRIDPDVVIPEPEIEPWSPETTYDSLVKLLEELRQLHPQDTAVLPRTTGAGAVRRRPGRLVAAAVAAALVVGAAGAFALHHRAATGQHVAAAPPRMGTVLVVLSDNTEIDGVTLLAHVRGDTQEILLPSRLLVDVPGQGSVPLGQALTSGVDAPAAAVENALQVRIDGSWILNAVALAKLVDAEGGVDVTLSSDVLPPAGATTLQLGPGTSHISGAMAVSLATAIGSQEPEASRLARQQILLEAILTKLPSTTSGIAALLQGAQLTGSVNVTSLATLLAGARADVLDNQAASTLVPTNEIDSGSGTPSYGLDTDGTTAMVTQRLAQAELPVPAVGRLRVLVQNGIGTPGLGDRARAMLVSKGFIFRTGGNASSFSDAPSVVLIPDASDASRADGNAVALMLGLPLADVELDPSPTTIADVKVILGSDFAAKATTTP
jgi:hypothetical protein